MPTAPTLIAGLIAVHADDGLGVTIMATMNAENESSRLGLDFGSAPRFTFHSVRSAFAWKSRQVVLAPPLVRGD
jgi:hypothetical protein